MERKEIHFTEMKIENSLLNRVRYTAELRYSTDLCIATIDGFDENEFIEDLLGRQVKVRYRKEFDSIHQAIKWLENKCEEIILEELDLVVRNAKYAQEGIDNINNEGFKL